MKAVLVRGSLTLLLGIAFQLDGVAIGQQLPANALDQATRKSSQSSTTTPPSFAQVAPSVSPKKDENCPTPASANKTSHATQTGCFIAAPEIIRSWPQSDYTLVDIRHPNVYGRIHVPGSLNIPLHALKVKAFLQNKPIVLIDEGYRPHAMRNACASLRQAGFRQVKILRGGLNAWINHGGTLNGSATARQALGQLPPPALTGALGQDWLVLDSTSSTKLKTVLPFTEATVVSVSNNSAVLKQTLRRAKVKQRNGVLPAVLLVSDNGQTQQTIERALQQAGFYHWYYLEGGWQAYQRHAAQYTALVARAQHPREKVGQCRAQ